jgi:diguanylate cyclase (GGDEF)-like protein/PAS domain S-box-containing protein
LNLPALFRIRTKRKRLGKVPLVGTWRVDVERCEFTCSDELYEICGLPKADDESSVERFLDCIHPEEKGIVQACWNHAVATQSIHRFTCRILRNGEERFLQCDIDFEFDGAGRVVAVTGRTRDVTDHVMKYDPLATHRPPVGTQGGALTAALMMDRELRVIYWNQGAEDLFGFTREEVLGKTLPIAPLQQQGPMTAICAAILNDGGGVRLHTHSVRKDGTAMDIDLALLPVKDAAGNIVGIAAACRPSRGVANEGAFVVSDRQCQALLRSASGVFMLVSTDLRVRYVSPAVANILGYTPEEVLNRSVEQLVHPKDLHQHRELVQSLTAGTVEKATVELRLKHKNGGWRHCETTFRHPYPDSSIDGLVVDFHDVTEKKYQQDLLQYMAYHDDLTGLANRRMFEEQFAAMIEAAEERGTSLAVLKLDLNRFKDVNDTLGHTTGDKLVKVVARTLRRIVRDDCIIARMDGDEFAILVPDVVDKQQVIHLAETVCEAFETPFVVDDYELYVTTGIGVSIYPDDGKDLESLMKHADIALNLAKEQGNNAVRAYTPGLNARSFKEFSLRNDFRKGLQNEEFLVHYQPRVNPRTGAIVGVEALIRWNHPDWGLLSPGEFLHIAEETGQMVDLGNWVIRTVCKQMRDWRRLGIPTVPVSVNVSAHLLLQHEATCQLVESCLSEYGIEPRYLEMEITETSILPKDPAIAKTIQRLRALGIRVFFDDFGTGYSSLSWLRQFELDGIKLDKSFVANVPGHYASTEIVSSVIQLAKKLQLTVVAEGVETKSQLEYLSAQGCDEVQGHLYSKPLPAEECERILQFGVIHPQTAEEAGSSGAGRRRRKYFRLCLPHPVRGQMTISQFNGQTLNLGYTDILVEDIGPGGLRFLSNLKLPENPQIRFRFKVLIMEKEWELEGRIVWKEEVSHPVYEYGVEFQIDESLRSKLTQALHGLLIQARRDVAATGCDYYTGDVLAYFAFRA